MIRAKASSMFYALTFSVILTVSFATLLLVYQGYGALDIRLSTEIAMRSFQAQAVDVILKGGLNDNFERQIQFRSCTFRVKVFNESWGVYDLVHIHTESEWDTLVHTIMVSNRIERNQLQFAITDHGRAIRVAGNAQVKGSGSFPARGFEKTTLGPFHFNGEVQVEQVAVNRSILDAQADISKRFISPSFLVSAHQNEVAKGGWATQYEVIDSETFYSLDSINSKTIVIGDSLYIARDKKLEFIMIAASQITVESGFEGSVQLFAEDVSIEDDVMLNYPSSVIAHGDSSRLEMGDGTEVHGVVANIGEFGDSYLHAESVVKGLSVFNGTLKLEGSLFGPSKMDVLWYTSPSSTQTNALINGKILPMIYDLDYGLPIEGKQEGGDTEYEKTLIFSRWEN